MAFLALSSLLMSPELVVLGKRGDANGVDQANAKEVILLEDDYIKLTLYYYNDYEITTTEFEQKKREKIRQGARSHEF